MYTRNEAELEIKRCISQKSKAAGILFCFLNLIGLLKANGFTITIYSEQSEKRNFEIGDSLSLVCSE